ncbi:MAG: NAD(P)-binding protein, partial [Spirochaetales bacterium]|nr:NAD(P)-binding protein [Spirochaetales bacterium]
MDSKAYEVERISVCTCIVGTGAAGYNAACRLKRLGQDDILLISENRLGGTSRSASSDPEARVFVRCFVRQTLTGISSCFGHSPTI